REAAAIDGSTIGVNGDRHVGSGAVHDARSLGDARPVAGVCRSGQNHGGPLGAQEAGQVLGDVEGEFRLRVPTGVGGAGGVAGLFLASVPHRPVDVGGVVPVVPVVTRVDTDDLPGQET